MENNKQVCKMTCRIEFNTGPGMRDNSVECNSTLDGEELNMICCYWASLDQLNPFISAFCWWNWEKTWHISFRIRVCVRA